MAKTDVSIMLKNAVVLGAGGDAKTCSAGSIVIVSGKLAAQLIEARAAVAYDEPRVADPVTLDPVNVDPAIQAGE